MAKIGKIQRKFNARRQRTAPYPLPSCPWKVLEDVHKKKKRFRASEKREWEDATCSVCMEFPHNAVLLLCSSYNKGCRPYMCATSYRHSNCLDQYKKAYTKATSIQTAQPPWFESLDNSNCLDQSELLCPLCRGQVKGWTVVEPARYFLNSKKRTCMNCSFVGTYKELRKHVKAEHPCARPREVDPQLEEKWKRLEHEREHNDVISTIRSSIPGGIIIGDYVIDFNYRRGLRDLEISSSLDSSPDHHETLSRIERLLHAFDGDDFSGAHVEDTNAFMSSRHHRRLMLGRTRRRRRHNRDAGGGGGGR